MKTVRLIGLGPSAVEAKPIDNDTDTWGIQYTWQHWKLDRAFVMDDEEWVVAKNHAFTVPIDVEKEMRDTHIPIYSAKKWSNVDNTVAYPLDEILEHFKPVRYFMNSFAYMIALAIYEKYERIETYGMDLRYFSELGDEMKYKRNWLDETHCAAFWAGVAIGRGIEFATTERSSLMKPLYPGDPSLYGYEASTLLQSQRKDILEARKKGEKFEVYRPEEGEPIKDFIRKVEVSAVDPVGTAKVDVNK